MNYVLYHGSATAYSLWLGFIQYAACHTLALRIGHGVRTIIIGGNRRYGLWFVITAHVTLAMACCMVASCIMHSHHGHGHGSWSWLSLHYNSGGNGSWSSHYIIRHSWFTVTVGWAVMIMAIAS
jgi:hypothetical protein